MIIIVALCFCLFFNITPVYGQQQPEEQQQQPEQPSELQQPKPEEINLGRIYFPRDFIHANKDYKKGVYRVKLIYKDEMPYFQVSNRKGELLFDELAVVKPYEGKSKRFKYRVKPEMLRGYEYFRIKVTKPDKLIMAYFLVKEELAKKEEESAAEEEKFN